MNEGAVAERKPGSIVRIRSQSPREKENASILMN